MKILFLNPCAQLGGAERCLLDVMASIRRCEPNWRLFLLTGEDGPLLALAKRQGVQAEALLYPPALAQLGSWGAHSHTVLCESLRTVPDLLRYRKKLRRMIGIIGPDLVHTNGFKMHILAALCGRRPVVWHVHDYLSARPAATRVLQLAASRCRGAIAISQSIAQDARQSLPGGLPVEPILNGIDLVRFHPHGPQLDFDELTGITVPEEMLRVGLIATYARWKGQEVFLRALAHPALAHVHIQAYVIGGPIYQTPYSQYSLDELRELARAFGVADRVSFTGFLPDSAAAMRSLDIVVHASTQPEPFGLVIAEAMACGRPVIAVTGGGSEELFTHDCDAIGIPPNDPAALAHAIATLADDQIARTRLGVAARLSAELRFDRDRLGPAVTSFYRQMVQPCDSSTSTAAISTAA